MKSPAIAPKPSRWRRMGRVLGFLSHWLAPFRASLALALLALLLQRVAALTAPALTKLVIDDVLGARRVELLLPIALALVAAALLQAGAGLFMTRILVRTSELLIAKLRQRVHAHILRLPIAFFDAGQAGNLAHRVLHEVAELEAFAGPFLLEAAGAIFTASLAFAVLVFLDPPLTLLVSLLLLVLAFVAMASLRHAFGHAREQNRLQAELSGRLVESLSAIRVIKAFRAEPREQERFRTGVQELFELALRGSRASLWISASSTALFGLATALIVYLAANRVLSGAMSLGEMVAFLACLGFLVAPLFELATMAPGLLRAASAMERTMHLLELPVEGSDARRDRRVERIFGQIAFENVSFGYGDELVLRDICFRAEPSELTAIVGPSGAGKSTVLSLLSGFYEPSAGRILVDGHDLASVELGSYRQSLALVPQEPVLFDGTIADNIVLAKPEATEAEIRRACAMAGVDAFVEHLPSGYEARVGERGANLSAGQKQRIAIARALLTEGPLLLLDEPTSALDAESESWLEPILSSRKDLTTIVVSHRLSTIRRADRILVLDGGQIVERGTHASLMAARGRYFRMYADEADVVPGRSAS